MNFGYIYDRMPHILLCGLLSLGLSACASTNGAYPSLARVHGSDMSTLDLCPVGANDFTLDMKQVAAQDPLLDDLVNRDSHIPAGLSRWLVARHTPDISSEEANVERVSVGEDARPLPENLQVQIRQVLEEKLPGQLAFGALEKELAPLFLVLSREEGLFRPLRRANYELDIARLEASRSNLVLTLYALQEAYTDEVVQSFGKTLVETEQLVRAISLLSQRIEDQERVIRRYRGILAQRLARQ